MTRDFVKELCKRVGSVASEYDHTVGWQYDPVQDTYRIWLKSGDGDDTIEADISDAGEDPSGAVLLKVEQKDGPREGRGWTCYVTAQAAALFAILYAS